MFNNNIISAFDRLMIELEQIITDLNSQIVDLTSQKEFNQAQAVLDKAKRVSTFQQKAQNLKDDWSKIDARASDSEIGVGINPGDQDMGQRTPSEFFHVPLLQALVDLGGKAHCQRVVARVGLINGDNLSEVDWQTLGDGKTVRWENSVHWARQQLVDQGLLLPMERRGYWEISPEGREALHESKKNNN